MNWENVAAFMDSEFGLQFAVSIHVSYTYKLGHKLFNGSYIWSRDHSFKSSPYPGQDSLLRVVIFNDMGKVERDGSNEYSNYQPGSLNTTDQLIKDLDNIDIVFHIGDLSYAWGEIACRSFGRSTRLTLQFMVMSTTMEEHAHFPV